MRSYGYINTPLDPKDRIFKASGGQLPEDYVLRDVHKVVDQGEKPICAAISLSHIIDWQTGIQDLKLASNTPENIYELREPKEIEGMVPRQALSALKKEGLGKYKIKSFARLDSAEAAKEAILTNGPVMACFNAYSGDAFWFPNGEVLGGHAVLLTGWEGVQFVMQNSWGYEWGSNGKAYFPEDCWKYVLECWTIMI